MEIFNDTDLVNYFFNKQMYIAKEVVDVDFKTQFKANKVYHIHKVTIEWISDKTAICEIFTENNHILFYRTCSKYRLYAELKTLFIPVSELFEAYKNR